MTTKQILYVGSTVNILQEIRTTINKDANDYEIDWCSNIIKALQKLVCREFDLILVQVNEHKSSGVCDLSAIRDIDPSMPIIALVDCFEEKESYELFQNGADEVLEVNQINTPLLSKAIFTAISRNQCRLTLKSIQNLQVEDDSQWKYLFHNLLRDLRHQTSSLNSPTMNEEREDTSDEQIKSFQAICNSYESFSKLKQYNPNFELTIVNSFQFLNQFYKSAVLDLKRKNINVRISLDKSYPRQLLTDAGRLQQVLDQFVSDYCKQFEELSGLEIDIKYKDSILSFFVKSDYNTETTSKKRQQIYPPFSDNEIAKTLLEQLLGQVEFFYDSRGRLIYVLNLEVPDLSAKEHNSADNSSKEGYTYSSCVLNHGRVLLLESHNQQQNNISSIFKRTGLQVIQTDNEHSFAHQLSVEQFDLIVADVDYFDSSFVFLNSKKFSNTPIVFLTSDQQLNHCVFSPEFILIKPLREFEILRMVYEIFQAESSLTSDTSLCS